MRFFREAPHEICSQPVGQRNVSMETVIGLKGEDYTLLAADTMMAKSIFFVKEDKSKIRALSHYSMMGVVGDKGDTNHFAEFITRNVSLYEIKNGYRMDSKTLVNFTRNQILANIINKVSCNVAMLLATYDAAKGPHLCFIDAQGATHSLNYSGHGLGSSICFSIFHLLWRPHLSLSDGVEIVHKCVKEIQNRLIINLRSFEIYVVDNYGVRKLESISTNEKKLI